MEYLSIITIVPDHAVMRHDFIILIKKKLTGQKILMQSLRPGERNTEIQNRGQRLNIEDHLK